MKDYPLQTLYFGIANVIANGLVMLRCVFSIVYFSSNRLLTCLQLHRPLDLPEH